jgi:membrane protease subunit HflK
MTDWNKNDRDERDDARPDPTSDGGEGDLRPLDVEEPRREASARFSVAEVSSSTADMRAAMDPANQSLAEALRLSYRVLQVGILALVVIFLVSGFQTVREGFTGVKTIFGRIVEGEDGAELSPGLQPFWPYPIGELVVFQQRRPVELLREFQPRQRPNQTTKQDAIDQAENRELVAERDGFVLTAEGDIAHISLAADYTISDAVEFLRRLDVKKSDDVVRRALMRGTVAAASRFTLPELVQSNSEQLAADIKQRAQELLDRLDVGITIVNVTFTDRTPPHFVENQFRQVQVATVNAQTTIETALTQVAAIRTGVAGLGDVASVGSGENIYDTLVGMIREYDAALVRGDRAAADDLMQKIGTRIEQPDVGGEVARIIQQARASTESMIADLRKEQARLEGLAPAFRENPRQLVNQLWLQTLRQVYAGPEVEIVSPPNALAALTLKVRSSQDIMQKRRQAALDRKKAEQEAAQSAFGPWMQRGSQIYIDQSSGRLDEDATKGRGRDDIRQAPVGGVP